MTPPEFKRHCREVLAPDGIGATTPCQFGRWAWVPVGGHKLKVKHYPARGWGVAKGPTAGPWCETLAEAYAGWLSAYEARPASRKAALRARLETATPRELRSMFTGLTDRQKRLAIKRALTC